MLTVEVQTGKSYWVEPYGMRYQIQVVSAAGAIPGWFICRSVLTGDETHLPLTAFREEVGES